MPGRNVVGTAVFFVRVRWALGMIRGVFQSFYGGCFKSLVSIRETFDGIFRRFWFGGETQRTAGLARTLRTHFTSFATEFVNLCREIVLQLGRAFILTFADFLIGAHTDLASPYRTDDLPGISGIRCICAQ